MLHDSYYGGSDYAEFVDYVVDLWECDTTSVPVKQLMKDLKISANDVYRYAETFQLNSDSFEYWLVQNADGELIFDFTF